MPADYVSRPPVPQKRIWDLKALVVQKIIKNGGWINTHTHLDRAFVVTPRTLIKANALLQEKWHLNDELKKHSTVNQIYDRMAYGLEQQMVQGVTALASFIDVDPITKDKAIKAAMKLREKNKSSVQLFFMNQTLKGVLEKEAQYWFLQGAQFVDIIGSLPKTDGSRIGEHFDLVLQTARSMRKLIHIHVDQLNTATEKETEMLINKTVKHNMRNKVTAVHSVSVAAHPMKYRRQLYKKMKKAGVSLITCPTAWIDSRRTEELAPTHNSIAPIEEMIENGITIGIGVDDIADIYKPFTDGDMWMELRFLLEACHYYDIDQLVKIATTNGRKILGIKS